MFPRVNEVYNIGGEYCVCLFAESTAKETAKTCSTAADKHDCAPNITE